MDKKCFQFELGQMVRVKKTLTVNVGDVKHLLGESGMVMNRWNGSYCGHMYELKFKNGNIETFEAWELDARNIKKIIKFDYSMSDIKEILEKMYCGNLRMGEIKKGNPKLYFEYYKHGGTTLVFKIHGLSLHKIKDGIKDYLNKYDCQVGAA